MNRSLGLILLSLALFAAASGAKPLREELTPKKSDLQRKGDLCASIGGTIAKVHVQENALVKKGELLFELKDLKLLLTLEAAKANVAVGQARLAQASQELMRANRLLEVKAMSREDHAAIAARFAETQAAVQRTNDVLNRAQQQLHQTKVHAPFDGKVVRLNIAAGDEVKANGVLATIHEIEASKVRP